MQSVIITKANEGQRLDRFLLRYLDRAPKGFVYKALRKKNIKLNSARAEGSEMLKNGDEIRLFFSDETFATLKSGKGDAPAGPKENAGGGNRRWKLSDYASIVYEDSEVIIANKKKGVLSQKAKPEDISLNEVLLDYAGSTAGGEMFTPSVCNRLDRNTTGLVVFARTYRAARIFNELFRKRSLKKYYLAAVSGSIRGPGHLKNWLVKSENQNLVRIYDEEKEGAVPVETAFEPLTEAEHEGQHFTLLKVQLLTGKSHQIRAQLANTGHPVLGDPKYGNSTLNQKLKNQFGIRSQMLHAFELVMPEISDSSPDDLSGRVFRAEMPSEFRSVFGSGSF